MSFRFPLLLALLISASALRLDAQQHVTTYKVEMRDGTRLATDVYLPSADAKDLPTILIRTPYNKKRYHRENGRWTKWGFAIAIQDSRGRFASEGKAVAFEADGWGELQDGYDTISWIRKQGFSNGKVGTTGASAMGITQLLTAPTNPPGLLAQYVLVASASSYDHASYVGGVFRKSQVERWLRGNGFHSDSLAKANNNPLYNAAWKPFDALSRAKDVRVPAIHLGGWYDTFSQGTVDAFVELQNEGGDGARGRQKLVMGPWTHGGRRRPKLGEFPMPNDARSLPVDLGARRWFDHHLKGHDNGIDKVPAVTYYVMGPFDGSESSGNIWRHADAWPIPAERSEWFASGSGQLTRDSAPGAATLEFAHDPDDPCPTIGGRNLNLPAGPRDQRPLEERDDVLVFTTAPLESDLEVTGRVSALVTLTSDKRDTDVAVRLTDVYPDGRSVLIASGIRRATLSRDNTKLHPLKPAEKRVVEVDLWATSIVFAKGHRIRMSISGSNYPRWESSTNTVIENGQRGPKEVARNKVHFGGNEPTRLLLPVVTRDENGEAITPKAAKKL